MVSIKWSAARSPPIGAHASCSLSRATSQADDAGGCDAGGAVRTVFADLAAQGIFRVGGWSRCLAAIGLLFERGEEGICSCATSWGFLSEINFLSCSVQALATRRLMLTLPRDALAVLNLEKDEFAVLEIGVEGI